MTNQQFSLRRLRARMDKEKSIYGLSVLDLTQVRTEKARPLCGRARTEAWEWNPREREAHQSGM
jgi:hypothetical protein